MKDEVGRMKDDVLAQPLSALSPQPSSLQAVVLVGGLGTRLRPLTLTTPKPLVPLVNRPVLAHVLDWLERGGVTNVILATQYAAAAFAPFLERWRGVPVRAIEETVPLGTAGAVRNVRALLSGTTVVVNGDNLTNLDLRALRRFHDGHGARVTIAVDHIDDPTGRGVVVADADGRVQRFQEKPAPGTALGNMVNTGTYLIEPEVLDGVRVGQWAQWETDVFPALIAGDVPVYAAPLPHRWLDVGTPHGYFEAQRDVLRGELGSMPGHEVRLGVWLEDNVSLAADAHVAAPVSLGFGAIVAAGVEIGGPVMLGRDVHVLPHATITRSALWDGTLVEQGAVIQDSIVGYNCYVGAGAQVAGALLGDRCVVQAGTVIRPGQAFAPDSVIEP